jgi:hypothetical protein
VWLLLEIYLFFRDFKRNWGTREARRKNLQGCLAVLAVLAFLAIIVLSILAARSGL